MILYIDREDVPDAEHIPPAVLRYCIERAERASHRYRKLRRYYLGDHDILRRKKKSPEDVSVVINYAKYVEDIITGYYLGEAIKYDANPRRHRGAIGASGADTEDGKALSGGGELDISPLIDCYDVQQMGRVDLEIGRTMGIMGECLELCYASTDETPIPKSACIDPQNGILVCDSSVEHNKLFGIVWERRERTNKEKYYFATVYTDKTEADYISIDLKTAVFHPAGPVRPHYFGAVPVIAYENNRERQGDFEQVISLIDAYDNLIADRLTDKAKFVDAVLAIFGAGLESDEDEKRLVENKLLENLPNDARVEYIQKTFDEAGVQVLADALVREIHKQTMTVDMSDEKFAGNASGQALKLKLLTMSLLVKGKMRQMERGLKERFALFNHWLYIMGAMEPTSVNDVDVVFTVSLPINEAEIVQMVTQLQGVVDDQTLLAQLWFIKDPAEALENIRRQKEENVLQYQKTFGPSGEDEEEKADNAAGKHIKDDDQ